MADQAYYKARVRTRGQITVPGPIRDLLEVEEGDELAFYLNQEGQIVIERLQVIPPEQAWFWTQRWQNAEHQVQEELSSGEYKDFKTIDEFIDDLGSES